MFNVGISGFAGYVPPLQVNLEAWCEWTGNSFAKMSTVVGRSFRRPGVQESVYTLAANAVLRLIDQYDVDPRAVGWLGLGTESSTDNAAGAVIVRGMIDRALDARGRPRLARACEVPEFKHACLGGMYALKAAARYVATDGRDRQAIVVAADIAEYARGSTGEPTQGAGAIAMLVEAAPKLLHIDLRHTGSASAFRGIDFRKPAARHLSGRYAPHTHRYADFPVFNGKYSTFCYVDAVSHATRDMLERLGESPASFFDRVAAIFMHRPYHAMPAHGLSAMYLSSLAQSPDGHAELVELAQAAGVDAATLRAEFCAHRDLFAEAQRVGIDVDPYPALTAAARTARHAPRLKRLLEDKLRLGSETMRDLGNLYTASLFAWLAAGLEEALRRREDLAEATLLAVGYGSGDAAEAMPLKVAPDWQSAAARIGLGQALEGSFELDKQQYERHHDGQPVDLSHAKAGAFVVDRVGSELSKGLEDLGVEYYRYVPVGPDLPRAAE